MVFMKVIETDLYLLDWGGAVYKVPLKQSWVVDQLVFGRQNVSSNMYSQLDGLVNRGGAIKQVLVVLAGTSQVLELDWTHLDTPLKSQTYSVDDKVITLISFRISLDFFVYELRDEQFRQIIYIFRRGSTLFANIFRILSVGEQSAVLEYDSRNRVLLMLTDSS